MIPSRLPESNNCGQFSDLLYFLAAPKYIQEKFPAVEYICMNIKSGEIISYFTKNGIYFQLIGQDHLLLFLEFEKSSTQHISLDGTTNFSCNFYISSDPQKWDSNIQGYTKLLYEDLYTNVDLQFEIIQNKKIINHIELKYEFRIKNNPCLIDSVNSIVQKFQLFNENEGGFIADWTFQNQNNDLTLLYHNQVLYSDEDLNCWFECGQNKISQAMEWNLEKKIDYYQLTLDFSEENQIDVKDYVTFVIDPLIQYSYTLGGSYMDKPNQIIIKDDSIYMIGATNSLDFISGSSIYDNTQNGKFDVFISKMKGDQLLFVSYFGGFNNEEGTDIAIDDNGNIYATGYTSSSDFPITVSCYQYQIKGAFDAFLLILSADGKVLNYSSYIGGSNDDRCVRIRLDELNCIYLAGYTSSSDFPITNTAYDTNTANYDCFFMKFSNPTTLLYSSFLGGDDYDELTDMELTSDGIVILSGFTNSQNFPVSNASYGYRKSGLYDVFITIFDIDSNLLRFSSYFGGLGWDICRDIAFNPAFKNDPSSPLNYIYITGYTKSYNFPTTKNCFDDTYNGEKDIFISILSFDLKNLIYSTYIGGSENDIANCIEIGPNNKLYLTGYTNSADFPCNPSMDLTTPLNNIATFIINFDPSQNKITYCTLIQGLENLIGMKIRMNQQGEGLILIQSSNVEEISINTPAIDNSSILLLKTNSLFDNDSDGLVNFLENDIGSNPLKTDTDMDGMPDGWEYLYRLNATDPEDGKLDSDNDGLSNYEEYLKGSNPLQLDSDHDFINDRWDPSPNNIYIPNLICILGIIGIVLYILIRHYLKKHKMLKK